MDASDLDPDPLAQLVAWQEIARQADEPMPEAICIATASAAGTPSARMVLLRGVDTGLVFFTDYESAKGSDLTANPQAAALLHWYQPRHRQIRLGGPVTRTSAQISDDYWASRPPASRRSAVASQQSAVIATRSELEARVTALGQSEPRRPERWGGFRLTPDTVEFWEEGRNRLHDRIRYRRAGHGWQVERLSP